MSYRVFQGKNPPRPGLKNERGRINPHAWYWEPSDYNGSLLQSGPFSNAALAKGAADAGEPDPMKFQGPVG